MTVKISASREEFQENAKQYVINMVRGTKKTLHRKNTKSCHWSIFLMEYLDFDSFDEAQASGKAECCCRLCFPEKMNP